MTGIHATTFFKELLFVCFLSWIYTTYTANSSYVGVLFKHEIWVQIQNWVMLFALNTRVSFLFTWKANRLTRIPLYCKTSGSRVLNPSSDIHNFIVQKIYYLYKKEFYKNSFKRVNIHVSLHCINLPKSTVVKDHYGYLRLLDVRPF